MQSTVSHRTADYIQQLNKASRRKRLIGGIASVLVLLVLVVGGIVVWNAIDDSQKQARARQLMEAVAEAPRAEQFQRMREAVDTGQVSRDQMREAMRTRFEQEEQRRLDAYFALPVEQRERYLDGLIDEMQQMRQQWERSRPATRPAGGPTTRPDGERGRDRGDRGQGPTDADRQRMREERQRRLDSMPAEERAKRAEFRAAMMQRLRERGIQPGRGMGGWGGGPRQ